MPRGLVRQKQMLHGVQQVTRLAKEKKALTMQPPRYARTLRSVVLGGRGHLVAPAPSSVADLMLSCTS